MLATSPLANTSLRAQSNAAATQSPHLPERIPPLDDVVNALEMEEVARQMLPRPLYDHIAAGAGTEGTLRRNRWFFDRITFRPRVLVDVTGLDLSSELFGQPLFAPMLVGPTASHRRMHSGGELATVAGASQANTTVVLSHRSSEPLERVAAEAKQPLWFQIDASLDAERSRDSVEKSVENGCGVICLTVGSPYRVVLARDVRNHYRSDEEAAKAWPPRPGSLVPRADPKASWARLEQVKQWAGVPVLVKGILHPEDAQAAVERGADGIVISNHGGRSTDGLPSTIEQLPKVADALQGRVPILIDGGFRRGTDMLKALALGANAILLGRPVLWALAAYGADGVRRLLEMLQHELALAMGLAGQPNLAAVNRQLVRIHKR